MTHLLSTRRGAIAFIALYVAISFVFLAQRISVWIDANPAKAWPDKSSAF